MAYTKYSLTPANNTASPPDGAPEGMLPSAVNDTMRDMMAQIRDCGDGVRDGTYTMTAVKITGGTINGATIGATTATTGKFSTLTNSALTSGRVTYAGASGLLSDSANLTWDNFNVRLGIGTASPSYTLDVVSTSMRVASGTTGVGYVQYGNSATASNNWHLGTEGDGTYRFFNGNFGSGTERMRIDSNGNLGVGTSSPASYGGSAFIKSVNIGTLNTITAGFSDEVTGTLRIAHASGQNIINFDTSNLCFQSGGSTPTERARITSSGRLLINSPSFTEGMVSIKCNASSSGISIGVLTNGDNAVNFYNSSNTYVASIVVNSGTVVYGTVSDYRFKENILPMTNALEKVSLLKPCTYTWKNNGDVGQGFIAHELQEVIPDAVSGKKDAMETYIDENGDEQTRIKPQGVDTSFVVATLTAAIQEQQALIESLTTRLSALENK